MHCQDCPRYDQDAETCRDGKLNPLRWDQAVEVANVFGPRAVCMFNDHRERLLQSRGLGQNKVQMAPPVNAYQDSNLES